MVDEVVLCWLELQLLSIGDEVDGCGGGEKALVVLIGQCVQGLQQLARMEVAVERLGEYQSHTIMWRRACSFEVICCPRVLCGVRKAHETRSRTCPTQHADRQ